jgi:hypothetical protein
VKNEEENSNTGYSRKRGVFDIYVFVTIIPRWSTPNWAKMFSYSFSIYRKFVKRKNSEETTFTITNLHVSYDKFRRSTLGRICIKWGDKKQYSGAVKMYTLGRMRKCKKRGGFNYYD